LVRGFNTREIATVLKVSLRTAETDCAAVREEVRASVRETTALSIAADVVGELRELRRGLHDIAARGNDRTRVSAANAIAANLAQEIATLQGLGVVFRQPMQVQIRQRMFEQFEGLTPSLAARIAAATTDDELMAATVEAFGAEVAREFLALPAGEVPADGEVTGDA
jgi:hypothetical protein